MKNFIILSILSLFLITCGGDQADVDGAFLRPRTPVPVDPWKDVGEATPEVTDDVRTLEFGDGMSVSYRGTDPGDREICRENEVEGSAYGVCMSLDEEAPDTPMESSSFPHPFLMLESFNGRITCTTGSNYHTDDECDVVFPKIGGPGFSCEAGVLNGDKALRCDRRLGGGGQRGGGREPDCVSGVRRSGNGSLSGGAENQTR